MKKKTYLGVIGGSGLYELEGLRNIEEIEVSTPFGQPSDKIITGELKGKPIAFLPRHGKGHRFTPTEVNYRANIYALKKIGVTHVLSVSAVGSLKEELAPGSVVIPSQIIDKTTLRKNRSFFGEGVVGHVGFAEPFCPEVREIALSSSKETGLTTHDGGSIVVVEGPRFSSRAESFHFREMGASIIGMTAMPEATLAREAEMPYCTVALVTDYDCWKENEDAVDVSAVIAVLKKNVENSKKLIAKILEKLPKESQNPLFSAAEFTIMTDPALIPSETRRKLELLYGKYWNK